MEARSREEETHVPHDDPQAEAMQRRVDAVPGKPGEADTYTIFRLAAGVRERHSELYEPKAVSVGPYYHGRDALRAMEAHKWRLLRDFLSRSATARLAACVRAARALEEEARRCYSEAFDMGSDAFVETLVLDGCFLLEFFLQKREGRLAAPGGARWAWRYMYHDLLLMDNQIPFFVVEKLHHAAFAASGRDALLDLFCDAFAGDLPSSRAVRPPSEKAIRHMLHLHYECNVRTPVSTARSERSTASSLAVWRQPSARPGRAARAAWVIPSASKLEEGGVAVKKKAAAGDVFDVSFRYGVLQMPAVVVDESAEVVLANLVAFEQSGGGREEEGRMVTGLVALVGSLVRTGRDVEVLRRCGVMQCTVSDEEAVRYFNHVVQYASMEYDHHCFASLFRDLRQHCHYG